MLIILTVIEVLVIMLFLMLYLMQKFPIRYIYTHAWLYNNDDYDSMKDELEIFIINIFLLMKT